MPNEDVPSRPPTLYVRRTRERTWCWCQNCPRYPLSVLENNGLMVSTTKPNNGDLCPECIALTQTRECTP